MKDEFKVICTEHISPLCKPSPEFVISEPDTFILNQLMILSHMSPNQLREELARIKIGNVVFFNSMSKSTQETFLETSDMMCEYMEAKDYDIADSVLQDFIIIFLEDCLKRAEEKAKC